LRNLLEQLKKQGYEIRDIELPNAHLGLAVYYIIMPAEVSSNLARMMELNMDTVIVPGNLLDNYLKSRHVGFGAEPRRRILLGTYVLSAGYYDAYYNKATKFARCSQKRFQESV
jgi:aspartyl-tRNA(Asn)/glutamyl-tRNA(Gln) amidotransferase subunit A